MDASGFDRLTKSLSTPNTRRALLRLLTAVPIAGALLTSLEQEGLAGKNGKGGNSGHGRNGGHGGKGGNGGRGGSGRSKGRKGKSRSRSNTSPPWSNPTPQVCDATSCADGCCDGTTCQTGTYASCGTGGGTCVNCDTLGDCTPDVCECRPGVGCCLTSDAGTPFLMGLGCDACCSGSCKLDDPVFPCR
jgi:hypothetical protein